MQDVVDVERNGLAWRERPGHRAPIVLLHGLGGSRVSWEPQLAALAPGHRVVAWDLPGYGVAEPLTEPVTFDALARSVERLLDALDGAGSAVHLVGISFGGMIAQYAAARLGPRVLTLTLLATSPKFGLDGTDPDAWRAARLAALDDGREPADFAEAVLHSLGGPSINSEAFAGQVAAMGRIGAPALRQSIDCLVTHDSRAILPSIEAPVLCIAGELDEETPVAYSQAIIDLVPDGSLAVVPGAGHLLNVEAPTDVNELIEAHIRSTGERLGRA